MPYTIASLTNCAMADVLKANEPSITTTNVTIARQWRTRREFVRAVSGLYKFIIILVIVFLLFIFTFAGCYVSFSIPSKLEM